MPNVTKKFSDLDLDFIPHPITGDIQILKDAVAVKRSLRNLLFTGKDERLFQSEIGGNLKQLLFEPITPMTEFSIKLLIQDVIRIYEPRVKVLDLQVSVSPDENGYDVHLLFAIDEISQVVTADLFLERLR